MRIKHRIISKFDTMNNIKTTILLLSAAMILPTFSVFGQKLPLTPDQIKQMHHETIDDAYKPNAYNNKKTSPAFRYRNDNKSNATGTRIITTQVNVDPRGNNITGDAANEPSIAVNPWHPEVIAIGWRQFDNVTSNFRQAGWGYTTDAGQTWTFPGVIDPGVFRSDPVLDVDASGNFYYNSLTNDPDYFCKVFRSANGGAAWDGGTDAGGGDKQWMVIDRTAGTGSGNIYSFWSPFFSTCNPGFFTRSTDGGDHYESCTIADGYPYWGTMAVGNSGELFIAGSSGKNDTIVVSKSLNANEKDSLIVWNKPVMVYFGGNLGGWNAVNPGGLSGQACIDVDHSDGPGRGNVYVLASVVRSLNSDPCDVMFARSTDGGLTWSAPVRVNDDASSMNSQWFGTMSVAPTGRIDAIWLDTRNAPAGSDSSALYYSYSTDQGITWSENERMSGAFDPHIGYPNQNKMGDYFDMVSDSTGAHLAWAGTFNGEQDVYYSHIIPQNSSGIHDISAHSEITVYPNPGKGIFTLSGLTGPARIEIWDILGQPVFSANCQGNRSEIDISAQPAGVYFLKIVEPNGVLILKKIFRQ